MATASITPDQDAIVAEIFIAAPPARVFEAIADPKQRAQWWGMRATNPPTPGVTPFRVVDSSSDLSVGGKWANEGVTGDGHRFHLEGEYLENRSTAFARTHEDRRLRRQFRDRGALGAGAP